MNRSLIYLILTFLIPNFIFSRTLSDKGTIINPVNNYLELFSENNFNEEDLLYDDLFQIDDSLLNIYDPESSVKPTQQIIYLPNDLYCDEMIYFSPNDTSKSNFLILTTPILWDSLHNEIKTYAEDVHAIYGYGVYVDKVSTSSPEQLKSVIMSHKNKLCGVILIGDFVACMFESDNDYNQYGYRKWACDLFYTDLDGEWLDADTNGIYDHHSGNVAPEIYLARLSTSGLSALGNEVYLIKKQLIKSHSFWWDASFFKQDTVLNYINKDWVHSFPASDISHVFSTNMVDDIRYGVDSCFSKSDYLFRLSQSQYGFTYLAAHSSPTIHQFSDGNISVSQIKNISSNNYAYNLFCCSALNWLSSNYLDLYLGGAYLFNNGKTIAVIGSTKTGSMINGYYFYKQFDLKNIGSAFQYWWNHYYPVNYHSSYAISWSYGLTILGDPTIHFRHNVNNYCVNDLVLTSFPQNNHSNYILYKAGNSITVTNKFVVPVGVHIVFDAPSILFEQGFECPKGASFETRNEGCKL